MCQLKQDKLAFQNRELKIIEATLSLLKKSDLSKLTMDKVITSTPFSKGTVYKHFSSKEDLIVGIANFMISNLFILFSRIVKDSMKSRKWLVTIYLSTFIYAMKNPLLFTIALCSNNPAVLEKSSSVRRAELKVLTNKILKLTSEIIDDGIIEGNLRLPIYLNRKQVSFMCWSSTLGVITSLHNDIGKSASIASSNLEKVYAATINIILDGLNWQPLSNIYDYQNISIHVLEKYFEPTRIVEIKPSMDFTVA